MLTSTKHCYLEKQKKTNKEFAMNYLLKTLTSLRQSRTNEEFSAINT